MTLVIGLTGSIATGKSTVSQMFTDLDIPVVDADQLSREVVELGKPAYNKIVSIFGQDILQEDKSIDRQKLGNIIFSAKEKRAQLNAIVHPEVRREMIAKRDHFIEKGYPAVVLDIPLLFESKLMKYVDRTIVVYVDEEVQLKRLMERDGSEAKKAAQRIQSQLPISEKADLADAVINNNGTREESLQQLKDILHQWKVIY